MCGTNRREIADRLKLYLVLETDNIKFPLKDFINMVVDGGVTAIQLRNKFKSVKENYVIGLEIKDILHDKDVLFVINDRIDLAKALNVNSVHIGVKDLPLKIVKEVYLDFIVGYSCNNSEDILMANSYSADYIGVGPAFFTDTKKDLRRVLCSEGIENLLKNTDIPAVAIGGINSENLHDLRDTGIKGVAVSSALCASENPFKTALSLRKIVDDF